jgi:ring-1,2-phenylacetyl-CoA epoxidase subunit PaaE
VFHPLTVDRVERLCDDAVALTFAVPDDLREEFAFEAGQFLTLRRDVDGRDERRSYSICAERGTAPRVGVREVPGGLFSSWLVREVRPGDVVEVHTPQGGFVAPPGRGGRHLLIAAGSGITPVLAIARTLLHHGDPGDPPRVSLVYGNRRTTSVMFADELADLKDEQIGALDVVHVLSREPRDVELFSGRLDADRLRRLLDTVVPVDTETEVWLCGPFGMIADARQVLAERGVPRERVHVELFYVEDVAPPPARHAEVAATGATSEVTIVLDGKESTAAFPRDLTLLDGAQRIRADLPFACKGGVCGTCRARVTEGQVDLRRNFALEDEEVAAGFVLTCQSVPVSDVVRVDFDA